MAAVSLAPTLGAFFQAFTDGGIPLNAGYINTYAAGGTTPKATYTTSAGNVANANPIVLGANGRPPSEVWLIDGDAYRFDVYDSAATLIKTYDNVRGIAPSSTGTFLPLTGGTMSGDIAMGTNKVTGLAAATVNGDAVRYEQSPAGILTGKGYLITATAANTPAVLAVGTNGQSLVANSNNANGVNWAFPALRSYLAGCGLSTAGASATMSIAAGTAVDSTNVSAMVLAATSKTTSSWVVGAANGGLDTGAIANSTWYHFFVIQRVDTGVVDVLISLSATSPTMPANYTLFRRIGAGLTNGSAQWVAFIQDGDLFQLLVPALESTGTNPGTNAVTQTLANVPTGVNMIALLNAGPNYGGMTYLSDLATTDAAPSATLAPLGNSFGTSSTTFGVQMEIRTNTSAQIRTRIDASGGGQKLFIVTTGWKDRRGRDA